MPRFPPAYVGWAAMGLPHTLSEADRAALIQIRVWQFCGAIAWDNQHHAARLRRLAWPGFRHVTGHLRRYRVGGEPGVNWLPEPVRRVLAELEYRLDRGDQ
jgi:hypothetical protein